MSGGSSQTTNQSQQSSTQPWTKAQPLLESLINSYTGMNTGVTPAQSGAAATLSSEAGALPSFAPNIADALTKMFGSSTTPQVGMLSGSLNNLTNALTPISNPANLDPFKTPGFSDALSTMTQDITNAVKGSYAGSGRDPTGAGSYAEQLARGISQGEAPVIASQYNANVGNVENAANALNAGTISGTGAMTGQQQVPLTNASGAISLIPGAETGATAPGATQLAAANTNYQLPWTNLSALLQPSVALGSLGQESQGSGTSTTTQQQSPFSTIMGGLLGGTGILSQMGAFGPAGWLLASDERVKEDVEDVGKLHDGQTVYRFRYTGDPTMRIGLLAQEVMDHEPDAVGIIPDVGMLAVEHKRATDRAAEIGRMAA